MSLAPGTSIGPYSIVREIGRGGMGVVYLARDPRLDRDVAIKALPEHLAQDPERLARFQSEARILAQLNNPGVAGIHGIEEIDGRHFLILEYVEGESLAERLDRGALPVDEALETCAKIASGLEAAHDAGVIHRDLKPDNVRITPDYEVKVLDFGLAKSVEGSSGAGQDPSNSHSPTMTTPLAHSPTMPGDDSRNGGVHVARAGARAPFGQADGHLVVRCGALRMSHRPQPFPRRDCLGHVGQGARTRA